MDADLDTLATALYVTSDDFLADNPQHRPWRPRVGLAPRLSDAELVTLVVLQALLGFTSEARFLRYAKASLRGMFPYLPTQSGYNKRIRAATGMLWAVIAYLVACTSSSSDDVWVVDSAPVECGRSRETAQRSDLAGWAEYGYCASHSRFFWGLRLHLVCTLSGLPVAFALAGAKADERDVLLAIFEADPNLVAARPQAEVDGGQELADVALLPSDLPVFEEPTSESFFTPRVGHDRISWSSHLVAQNAGGRPWLLSTPRSRSFLPSG